MEDLKTQPKVKLTQKEYNAQYYATNKARILSYAAVKTPCPVCNKLIVKYNLSKHCKSSKCMKIGEEIHTQQQQQQQQQNVDVIEGHTKQEEYTKDDKKDDVIEGITKIPNIKPIIELLNDCINRLNKCKVEDDLNKVIRRITVYSNTIHRQYSKPFDFDYTTLLED